MPAIDTSDIPEASEGFFQRARLVLPRKHVRWVPERTKHRTEVEDARSHLVNCQHHLRQRRHGRGVEMMVKEMRAVAMCALIAEAEREVLAALSWVWDAQERAGLNRDINVGDIITLSNGRWYRIAAVSRGDG